MIFIPSGTSLKCISQEAILLNSEGYVTECSGDNIFFIRDGEIYTPPVHAGILDGITRQRVIGLLRGLALSMLS